MFPGCSAGAYSALSYLAPWVSFLTHASGGNSFLFLFLSAVGHCMLPACFQITLVVADVGDSVLDSAVFIKGESVKICDCGTPSNDCHKIPCDPANGVCQEPIALTGTVCTYGGVADAGLCMSGTCAPGTWSELWA